MDFYKTIEKNTVAELNERGSRFIAYAYLLKNMEDFKVYHKQLKKEHVKATHHCFAYRFGTDRNVFRVSDDGEPAGSAGKPILSQIDALGITNILVVVVRYFGGTMLGISGLVNAYKQSTSMALQLTPVVNNPIEIIFDLSFNYQQLDVVMRVVKTYNIRIIKNDIQLFCHMIVGIPKNLLEKVLKSLKEINNLEIKKME